MHFENDEVWYRKRECKKLKEKVETLELWLDNKEKLNEEYRKLIQKIDQLEEENENLRKDLFHLTNNGKSK
jgi:predicted  nucleic acid-binding Zn-ribbon protein